MGFAVIDPNLAADSVVKLKLPRSPPTNMLLSVLETSPTRDLATARKWFEFLATRLAGMCPYPLYHVTQFVK